MGGMAVQPYTTAPMSAGDVDQVLAIERASFSVPWSAQSFLSELALPYSIYRVVRLDGAAGPIAAPPTKGPLWGRILGERAQARLGPVVGYAGLQVILDEGHITTIAVHPEYRQRGIGELLLLDLFEHALPRGVLRLTLEVRVSNLAAQALYERYGFTLAGRRLRYYANNEDALIMWTDRQDAPEARTRLEELRCRLLSRWRVGGNRAATADDRSAENVGREP